MANRLLNLILANSKSAIRIPQFLFLFCSLLLAPCIPAQAQYAGKIPRIGYLRLVEVPIFTNAFQLGLKELGYIEGKNVQVEYRFAEGNLDRLQQLAAELVNLKVDVIVAGATQAVDAARKATKTIPIVFPVTFDPVGSGLVESLAKPGGNITGLSTMNPDIAAKRVEQLKEILPKLNRVTVLSNPTNSGSHLAVEQTEVGAKQMAVRVLSLQARSIEQIDSAFESAAKDRAQAVIVIVDTIFLANRGRVADLGIRHRMPTMFDDSQFVEAGGLISYGASLTDLFRRSAIYVDKILKGRSPAELPVEQPMKFEFIINLKTAKQIGLTIPPNVLARADRVIR